MLSCPMVISETLGFGINMSVTVVQILGSLRTSAQHIASVPPKPFTLQKGSPYIRAGIALLLEDYLINVTAGKTIKSLFASPSSDYLS